MGKLIDADFLISYIEEELALKYTGHLSDDVVCGMISRQNEIIQFIKAQPTAFNVEAVVKELDNAMYYDEESNPLQSIAVVDLNEALEIVRKGGVK